MNANIFSWKSIDKDAVAINIESGCNLYINKDESVFFSYNGAIIATLSNNRCRYSKEASAKVRRIISNFIKRLASGKAKIVKAKTVLDF